MFRYVAAASTCLFCFVAQFRVVAADQPAPTAKNNPDPGWEVERYYVPDEGVREGETVISMSADIDGDGIPERLVTTNYQRNGKFGNMWTVYDVADGRIREMGDAQFDADYCGVFIEQGFAPVPRLYAFRSSKESTDLITFSRSGGKVITETAKEGVDFTEYADLMKKSPAEIRTRDAAEVYNLYTREHVEQLTMTEAESRAIKTRTADRSIDRRQAKANMKQGAGDVSPAAGGGIPSSVWYAAGICLLGVTAVFKYWSRKSA